MVTESGASDAKALGCCKSDATLLEANRYEPGSKFHVRGLYRDYRGSSLKNC